MKPEPVLYLNDSRGIYLPQSFAEQTKRECVAGIDDETWTCLLDGPDEEWYWDAWDTVLNSAVVTDPVTHVSYHVHQDGDCWLIPFGMEWNENEAAYVWPEQEENRP